MIPRALLAWRPRKACDKGAQGPGLGVSRVVSRVLRAADSSAQDRGGSQAALPWTFPSTVPSRRGASSPVAAFAFCHSSGV